MTTVAERVQQNIERGHTADLREARLFLRGPAVATTDIALSTSDYLALSEDRRITRRASSTKSATRNSARPCPMRISGSGAAMSVHCGGTEQMVPSSTRSKSRLPDRFQRSPTQISCWPANGWKG